MKEMPGQGVHGGSFLRQLTYLSRYLKPHRKIIALSLSLSVLSTTLGMIQPYFAKILIDSVFMEKNGSALAPLLSIMIGLLLSSFIVRVVNNYIYTGYSARLLFAMRRELFDRMQRVSLKYFTRQKIGDLYSRIGSDMADIQSFLTDAIPHFLFNFLTCVVTAVILLWLNWKMALMSFAFLPFGLWVIGRIRPDILKLSRNVAETNADISQFLFESLGNTHMIRAFGAREAESERLDAKHGTMLGYLLRYQVLGAFSGSVPTVFIVVNTLVVFGYGGLLVLDGGLTVGSLVAFSIYQGRVFSPLQGLLDGFLAMQKSKVAFQRVQEIMDLPLEAENDGDYAEIVQDRMTGPVEFRSVSFAYNPGEPVLSNLSFSIPEGRTTALVGPSGVGKSTICHLLMRLLTPDEGEILVGGTKLRRIDPEQLKKSICIVSQDIFLFHTTVHENIRYGKADAEIDEVIRAARAACIHDYISRLPNGYDTVIGDRGVALSGGQKQRVCIARAFLANPKILILDEASAFLDADVESQLKQTMRFLMRGRTILVVSHRESSISDVDKIVALDKSGLLYEGPPEGYVLKHGRQGSHNR